MDTKKEPIGDLYRAGHLLTQGVIETFDHDFPSFAEGVVISPGLCVVKRNDGHVKPGISRDLMSHFGGRLDLERLPPYAPMLNPANCWGTG
jgi:hypothetical protein